MISFIVSNKLYNNNSNPGNLSFSGDLNVSRTIISATKDIIITII